MNSKHDDRYDEPDPHGATVPMTPPSGWSQETSPSQPREPVPAVTQHATPASDASASTLVQDPLMGTVLSDRYRLRMILGQGGMGKVYLAEDTKLNNRRVAIKLMTVPPGLDSEFTARFRREALLQANLPHGQIIQVLDVGETDHRPYMVMEYSDGRSLSSMIRELGPISLDRALHIAEQTLEVLDFAHRQGVVHRDLKPSNILIEDRAGRPLVRILDFGIAKLLRPDQESGLEEHRTLTRVGFVVGTPGYMAPEQAAGDAEKLDHRADLYSVGILFYEMLTGKVPCPKEARSDLVRYALWVCQNEVPLLAKSHPHLQISRELDEIVSRALAPAAEDRFSSAYAFLSALRAYEGVDVGARTPPSTRSKVRPKTRRPRTSWRWVQPLLWLALLGGVSWFWGDARGRVDALEVESADWKSRAEKAAARPVGDPDALALASSARAEAEKQRDAARAAVTAKEVEAKAARESAAELQALVTRIGKELQEAQRELEEVRKKLREVESNSGAGVSELEREKKSLERDLFDAKNREEGLRTRLKSLEEKVLAIHGVFLTTDPQSLKELESRARERLEAANEQLRQKEQDFQRANATAANTESQHRALIARNAELERQADPPRAGRGRLKILNEVNDRNIRIIVMDITAILGDGRRQAIPVRDVPIYYQGTPYEVSNLPAGTQRVEVQFRRLHRFKANLHPESAVQDVTEGETRLVIN